MFEWGYQRVSADRSAPNAIYAGLKTGADSGRNAVNFVL